MRHRRRWQEDQNPELGREDFRLVRDADRERELHVERGQRDVAGNSFSELTVMPKMMPSTSAVSPNLYGDTLTITTNAPGDDPHTVDLLMTAHGAILEQSTGAMDFGSVLASAPATSTFTVSNSGNAPATVSYTTKPAAFSVSPQAQVVGAAANYIATARFAPTAEQPTPGRRR